MTATDTIADLRRELEKAHDTLEVVQRHLAAVAEGNAALHCADRVIYSPLHAKVEATVLGIDLALQASDPPTNAGSEPWMVNGVLCNCEPRDGRHHPNCDTNLPPEKRSGPRIR